MRWRTILLTAVLIATTSANIPLGVVTLEDNPLNIQYNTDVDSQNPTTEGSAIQTTESDVIYTTDLFEQYDSNCSECRTEELRSEENVSENEPPNITNEESSMNIEFTTRTAEFDSGTEHDISVTTPSGDGSIEESGEGIRTEELIIQTNSGPVQGFAWLGNENIISYFDIPYGSINNPLQAPTSAESWETIHNARNHDKRCPQLQNDVYVGDTDCLTLNIFKPLNAEDASVLFHIHAENFTSGSGDPFIYGPDYLVANGIILVLPNYRLGALGFLCMQNETAPGNMGLKDLSLALSWIHENIRAFGGDPDKIAVSGDGRSGALAGLLALSPMSREYVSKVIVESGSFLSYWALDRDPTATAEELIDRIVEAEEVESRRDILLEDLTPRVIVTAAKGIEFKPCLESDFENAFMTETPYTTLTTERIETAFLIGYATYAGIHEALDQTEDSITRLNEDFTQLLPNDLRFSTLTLRRQIGERIKTQYFGEEPISIDDVQNISLCFTDMGYLGPGIRSARLLVEAGATVYFYEFAFVGELNRVLESVNHPVHGAVRGDIVGYLFTQDGIVPDEGQTDESQMIATLTEMWTSFLKTGTPSTDSIEWHKLEDTDELEEEWLLINSEPSMQRGLHVDRLPLWTEIYEEHYVDGNHGQELSPSICMILMFQYIFWLVFCRSTTREA